MSSLRNNKNIQSAIASAAFVGLRAEHCTVTELFSTAFHSDDGLDVFTTIKTLQEQVEELKLTVTTIKTLQEEVAGLKLTLTTLTAKIETLKLSDLKDVKLSNVSDGDTLVSNNGVWQAAEQEA